MNERDKFTFHYVSINIRLNEHKLHFQGYLHSTMYLLILEPDRIQSDMEDYLHSTMYLLI